jgi:hypothetical protein
MKSKKRYRIVTSQTSDELKALRRDVRICPAKVFHVPRIFIRLHFALSFIGAVILDVAGCYFFC